MKRESFTCKNCGEKILFYLKHGRHSRIWLHAKTNTTDCGMRAEPE